MFANKHYADCPARSVTEDKQHGSGVMFTLECGHQRFMADPMMLHNEYAPCTESPCYKPAKDMSS